MKSENLCMIVTAMIISNAESTDVPTYPFADDRIRKWNGEETRQELRCSVATPGHPKARTCCWSWHHKRPCTTNCTGLGPRPPATADDGSLSHPGAGSRRQQDKYAAILPHRHPVCRCCNRGCFGHGKLTWGAPRVFHELLPEEERRAELHWPRSLHDVPRDVQDQEPMVVVPSVLQHLEPVHPESTRRNKTHRGLLNTARVTFVALESTRVGSCREVAISP
ncbi:hypothetical protein MRX96_009607 [Rhipicephalus microplus]